MSDVAKAPASGRANLLIVLAAVGLIVGFLLLRLVLFGFYSIPSGSEEPTLWQGDYIVTTDFSYGFSRYSIPFHPIGFNGRLFGHPPRRGDVVVFKLPRDPNIDYIKRVIGLPGDHVQLKAGVVYINGQPMARRSLGQFQTDLGGGDLVPVDRFEEVTPEGRRYLIQYLTQPSVGGNTGVYVVPPHCYFVLGDNRDNSLDSRHDPGDQPGRCGWDASVDGQLNSEPGVGFVPEENLVGRALTVLFVSSKSAADGDRPFRPIR